MGKHLTYLLLLWLIFCAGCARHQDYPEAIQRAESCMDEHPDSALHLLTAYADSGMDGNRTCVKLDGTEYN